MRQAKLPDRATAAVLAEKIRAGRDFDKMRKSLPFISQRETALRTYILRQLLAFAVEGHKLCTSGAWTAEQFERECEEFLRRCTIDAVGDKGDGAGKHWTSNLSGSLTTEAGREFRRCPEWRQYEDLLLAAAEAQASGSRSDGDPEKESSDVAGERSRMLSEFLERCNREGGAVFKIRKIHVWRMAGHTTDRQLCYWQKASPQATKQDDANFRRILSTPPKAFVASVRAKLPKKEP
jgi:hypothetical protein